MNFEERNIRNQKAHALIYQLMEAGKKQSCAKSLIISDRNPEVIRYAREKLHAAQLETSIIRDKLWELFNGRNEIRPEDADHYEFLIQKAWAAQRKIRKAEKMIIDTDNPFLEEFLRKELSAGEQEVLFAESKIFIFLQDLADRAESESK